MEGKFILTKILCLKEFNKLSHNNIEGLFFYNWEAVTLPYDWN